MNQIPASGKFYIILIGGCSRSGKSTLAKGLHKGFEKCGVKVVNLNLDRWIIDFDKREIDSTVMKRFNVPLIIDAIFRLLDGETVQLPTYDPILRRQIKGNESPVSLSSGILIIEGVIALAISELLNKADLKIFVDISESVRKERLKHFYQIEKGLSESVTDTIILEREYEEVPFIKNTKKNADFILNN